MSEAALQLNGTGAPCPRSDAFSLRDELILFLASMVTLYFELLIIRYVSSEVRVFANLKNLPLVASFFGIGVGMVLGSPKMRLRTLFPAATVLLFVLTRFAMPLHLSFGDVSWEYNLESGGLGSRFLYLIRFMAVGLGYSVVITVFFRVLGGYIGQYMKRLTPLKDMRSTCRVVWPEWHYFLRSLFCIEDRPSG